MIFADVILPLPLKNVFTYEVPKDFYDLKVGMRVIVQFGQKKFYTALVYATHNTLPSNYTPKQIQEVLDSQAVVTEAQFRLWNWMSEYYCCSLGEIMNSALPSVLKLSSETKLILESDQIQKSDLTDKEYLVIEALEQKKELSLKEVSVILNQKTIFPVINTLLKRNIISLLEEINEKYRPKTIRKVKLVNELIDESVLKNAKKQKLIVEHFLSLRKELKNDSVAVSQLLKSASASYHALNSLIEKGIFSVFKDEISRLDHFEKEDLISYDLSPAQKQAFSQIKTNFEEKDVVLLHGVTSSGKTEIYIKLIREAIDKGYQVLYLLPEIALTTQIINRLRKHFGDLVGVYHSKFNNNERAEIWNEVQNSGRFPVILGTRSSIFLPFSNLGLIIVDEEHENTFKQQQPSPRYNARDTVIKYAQMLNAKVLLASATPSLESYHNALQDKYALIELNERYGGVNIPKIDVEDIKYVAHRKQMKGAFSPKLLQAIEDALSKNEQVILFQNRRGFAPVSECKSCGWTVKCVSCDVSLTYHKYQEILKCHYCGYSEQPVKRCKSCGSMEVVIKGYGTEKLEEELQFFFTDAIIKRLDLDTSRKKYAYDSIIYDFENRKIDILIGTQMITKGLDFNNVSLVGVINADSLLNYPNFRSHERSYQLMVQVAGRSGRKEKQGNVIVQTYSAEHYIIKSVKDNDYMSMYKSEISERELFNYPPFCKLISINVSHKDYELTNQAARELAIHMRAAFGKCVLGPEYPVVSRVKNRYLKNIILKIGNNLSLKKSKKHLLELVESLNKHPKYLSVRFTIDVDPN